jgi:exodeoxyribonuclease VII small subunit
MASKTPSSNPVVENSIESSLSRLETIVDEIERNPPSLETMIERYEEGMRLLQICREKLDVAEKRIEMIARTNGGEPILQPFEES